MRRALLAAACAAACVAACATVATVFGTGTGSGGDGSGDEILFPHARHAKAQVDCVVCHETVYDAKTLAGDFLPKEAKCLECHKEKKTSGQCSFCHTDAASAAPWPAREPRLNFDHAGHLERVKDDCTRCHTQLSEPRAPAMLSSGHAACLQCHGHAEQYADASCATCHVDLSRYPLLPTNELTHQGDFLRRHSAAARSQSQACATCHEQNFCLDCHATTAMAPIETILVDRPDRRFIHRPDFLGHHAVDARADAVSCQRCHAVSTCETCHQREHVSAGTSARNPHPPGWVIPGAGGSFHGDAARANIESCAACHDQGDNSNCVGCHKVGGTGGDPHPAGFRARHNLNDARTDGRCVACHR